MKLTTQLAYDANGNLKQRTDAAGAITTYDYDALNRLTTVHYPDKTSVTFTYDAAGRRTEMHDALGTTKYAYDIHSRLTQITDPNGHTLRYAYDPRGLLAMLIYPDNSAIAYAWDAGGRLTTVKDASGTTRYTYDTAGRVAERVLPNGVTTTYTYDAASRLTALRHTAPGGTLLVAFEYVFDAGGNRAQVARTEGNGTPQVTSYRYDALSRLVWVGYPDGEEVSYTYDAVSNRTMMQSSSHGETRYTYNDLDQLTRQEGPDGTETFRYDERGNVVERKDHNGQAIRYSWDHENRLVQVADSQKTVSFSYDGDGHLLRQLSNGSAVEYIYDARQSVPKLVAEKSHDKGTMFYPIGWERLGESGGPAGSRFYLTDGDENVVGVSDPQGQLVASYSFDPYGMPVSMPISTAQAARSAETRYGTDGTYYTVSVANRHHNERLRTPVPPRTTDSLWIQGWKYNPQADGLFLGDRLYRPQSGQFMNSAPYPFEVVISGASSYKTPDLPRQYGSAPTNTTLQSSPFDVASSNPSPYKTTGFVGQDGYAYNPITFHNIHTLARAAGSFVPSPQALRDIARDVIAGAVDPAKTLFQNYTDSLPRRGLLIPTKVWLDTRTGAVATLFTENMSFARKTAYLRAVGEVLGKADKLLNGLDIGASFFDARGAYGLGLPITAVAEIIGAIVVVYLGGKIVEGGLVVGGIPGAIGGIAIALVIKKGVDSIVNRVAKWETEGGSFGGVSLDRAATVLGNLHDITGATYDPRTGQVVLIGRKDARLPPMNIDDLAVAIRAVYAGQNPGVTMVPIDPSGQDTTQRVEYFGQTEGTRFGQVMFEADRYLKSLSAGQDTITGAPLAPNVPGFQSEVDLALNMRTNAPWHRNWFVPSAIVLKRTADGQSMVFDQAAIKLESRFVQFQPDGSMVDISGSSPVTEQFSQFLTDHYDQFAADKRELAELVRLAKIVGVVKWLRDSNIPVDLSWIANYDVKVVPTPVTTPGVVVQKSTPDGTFTISSFGGVDFSTENTYTADPGEVKALRDQAMAARPAGTPMHWDFQQNGVSYTAVALNLAPARIVGGYTATFDDLEIPVTGDLTASFTRVYNSLDLHSGALGPGWSLAPFALEIQETVRPVNETQQEVQQQITLRAGMQREVFTGPFYKTDDSEQAFMLPENQTGVYRDILLQADGYLLRRKDGINLLFNMAGQLQAITDSGENRVGYSYNEVGQLIEIADSRGHGLRLVYNADGQLIKVMASDGRAIHYTFDSSGYLIGVSDQTGTKVASYTYDTNGRLSQSMDGSGQVVLTNSYDQLGRVTATSSGQEYKWNIRYNNQTNVVVYTDIRGNSFTRRYDEQNRLVEDIDPQGKKIALDYGQNGHLASIVDRNGSVSTFKYDANGYLTEVLAPTHDLTRLLNYNVNGLPEILIDPAGRIVFFQYDSQGRITGMKSGYQLKEMSPDGSFSYDEVDPLVISYEYDPSGNLMAAHDAASSTTDFAYDEVGNLVEIQLPDGQKMTQTFNDRSQLTTATDVSGYKVQFEHDQRGQLTAIIMPASTTTFHYTDGRITAMTDPGSNTFEFEYTPAGLLKQVTEPGGAKTSYEYDTSGQLVGVRDALGRRVEYVYNVVGQPIAVTRTYLPEAMETGTPATAIPPVPIPAASPEFGEEAPPAPIAHQWPTWAIIGLIVLGVIIGVALILFIWWKIASRPPRDDE